MHLPLSEHTLCYFLTFLVEAGLSPQTAKAYLSALRNLQISLDLPDPRKHASMPRLKRIQAGIARMNLSRGSPRQIRLPIMAQALECIICYPSHPCP